MYFDQKPNLFQWATSELSQDAFLAWLASWADPKYQQTDSDIHDCAKQFLCSLLNKETPLDIDTLEIKRQWKNIDVLICINKTIHIIIEDKTFTSEHSDQLQRYFETVKKEYNNSTIYKIYFKMHEQGNYRKIEDAGYTSYTRKQMLSILGGYIHKQSEHKKNDIIIDFYHHLKTLEQNINSYLILPIKAFNYRSKQKKYTYRQIWTLR